MTFQEFQNIFQTPWLSPWEHDYYVAIFAEPKTNQEFLDYAYEQIDGLTGIWYDSKGSAVYFLVKKGTVFPENFAVTLELMTDVPEQSSEEGTV